MAKAFEIDYDIYCLECSNFSPLTGSVNVQVDFSVDTDSGTTGDAALSGATATISDGTSENVVLAGTSGTFSHTFTSAGEYTIMIVTTYNDGSGPAECGPHTITIE